MENIKPKIVVLDGPSGVGKDTIVNMLITNYPDTYVKMPSTTTRAMRENESQGKPYFFVTEDEFKAKIASKDVFEYTITKRDGAYKGMSKGIIDEIAKTGKVQIKDCDEVGLNALRKEYGKVVTIFLMIEKDEIEKRLRCRGGTDADIQNRLSDYDDYIDYKKEFEHIVPNTDASKCVADVHAIISNSYAE